MKKVALLFAGCIDQANNYKRYQNDLGYMYKVLQQYNYDRVDVLYSDGSEIIYDNTKISTIDGAKKTFFKTLNVYEATLEDGDFLFIMVSNHGTLINGVAGINCWGKEIIYQDEFCNALSRIRGNKVIVLGQCYGGNFLNEKIPNSTIISANSKDKVSFGSLNGEYDEFLYHFISFYNNQYPDGSPLSAYHTSKSVFEAFLYAKNNDSHYHNTTLFFTNPLTQTKELIHEDPQIISYSCDPNNLFL